MAYKLNLIEFKAKHGLSNADMFQIIGVELDYTTSNTDNHPEEAISLCNKIDVVVDRIKLNGGIFTVIDAQQAAHIIGKQNKKIDKLESEIEDFKRSSTTRIAPKRKKSAITLDQESADKMRKKKAFPKTSKVTEI